MTPQTKLVLAGAAVTGATKFYFQKSWCISIVAGLGAIAVIAILTATPEPAT